MSLGRTPLLVLALWLGALLALAGPQAARARDAAKAPVVHGLAPLPSGAVVPLADRPPGALPGDGGPSPVVFPAQEITIRFNHRLHVRELDLACTDCHTNATSSRLSQDSLLPKPTQCDGCHKTDHRELHAVKSLTTELISQCGYCHIGYQPEHGDRVRRQRFPAPHLKFSHQAHSVRNIGCAQCHGQVDRVELATRDQLPRMRGCFNCHQMPEPARGDAPGECTACHLSNAAGRMRTEFPEGRLEPPNWLFNAGHDANFLERHKFVAGNNSELCTSCHSESYCTDCHDGRVRPRNVHPNDFLSLHAIAARQNSPDCSSCHRAQSFCLGCHQRAGVTLSGPMENFAARGRFHPPKSVWTDGAMGAEHHGSEARRNISACVSCHTESDCVLCHAAAELGGGVSGRAGGITSSSPHGPGFSTRCRGALRRNARSCLTCHHPQDAKLGQCR